MATTKDATPLGRRDIPWLDSRSDLLRFAAIGSVDDGKSTLIGRLLYDTQQLFEDQVEALSRASRRRGRQSLELSFATDGLRSEREQGITIDVAYRYAATPRRKYVIADCPGHVQYTRNMATGASTADLAVVVVDVVSGLREQTRRHCSIAALFGVRHLIVAVNKMDLVDWDRQAYERVVSTMRALADRLQIESVVTIPVSALFGDNVAEESHRCPWYAGPTVLAALEEAPAEVWDAEEGAGWRLPIQWVTRHDDGSRGYAGMLVGGSLCRGEEVLVLPRGQRTRISSIDTFDGELDESPPLLSIAVRLEDDLDVGRGDLIAPIGSSPRVATELEATICWFAEASLVPDSRYKVKHTTRLTPARCTAVTSRFDLSSLSLVPSSELEFNDIGIAHIETGQPIVVDEYRHNRVTGSFVVIDERTNVTVGAGLVGVPGFASRRGASAPA